MGGIFKVIIEIIVGAGIFLYVFFYRWNEGSGIGFALIMTFIISHIYWIQIKPTEIDWYKYKRERSETNPLYAGGYFRSGPNNMGKRLMLAGPKALYWCEIHAIVQLIVIWIYGILSIWRGENLIIQDYLMAWMAGGAVVKLVVALYYEHIIKRYLKKKNLPKKLKWMPFSQWTNDKVLAEQIPVKENDIKKVEQNLFRACEKQGYVLFKEYYPQEVDSVWFFVKKQRGMINVFAVVKKDVIGYHTEVLLNQMVKRFFEEYLGTENPITKISFMFCAFIDGEMDRRINKGTQQLPWRYVLQTYYSFKKQEFLISGQKSKFGRRQYERMYREFLEILEEIR